MDFIGCPGRKKEPEGTGKKKMKDQQDKKELDIGMLVDDPVVEDQGEKQDGHPDDGDQDCLCKLAETRFAVNFAIGAYQGVKDKPK